MSEEKGARASCTSVCVCAFTGDELKRARLPIPGLRHIHAAAPMRVRQHPSIHCVCRNIWIFSASQKQATSCWAGARRPKSCPPSCHHHFTAQLPQAPLCRASPPCKTTLIQRGLPFRGSPSSKIVPSQAPLCRAFPPCKTTLSQVILAYHAFLPYTTPRPQHFIP